MSKVSVVALLLLLSLGLMSCKDISADNYDKLKVGMAYNDITGIIGKPDKCTAVLNIKNCVWTDDSKEIRIKFAGDQAVFMTSRGLGQ